MEAQNEVKATGTFDVAISFLARDEKVASALCDVIGDGLNVFFFPRKQEELAGTNGLESMRTPFLTSRVVVVLYRVPWGETNWTRVEQAAVTDRFLKEGWDWLLFVQLDETRLPVWLEKRGLYGPGQRRVVTGLVVTPEKRVSLGRERKRNISSLVHKASLEKLDAPQMMELKGLLGFVHSAEPRFLETLRTKYGAEVVRKIVTFEDSFIDRTKRL